MEKEKEVKYPTLTEAFERLPLSSRHSQVAGLSLVVMLLDGRVEILIPPAPVGITPPQLQQICRDVLTRKPDEVVSIPQDKTH